MSNDVKDFYVRQFLNDPILKWVLRLIGVVLLVYIVIFTIRAAIGKHVNLLGIEINIPDEKKLDTVRQITYVNTDSSTKPNYNADARKKIPDYILAKNSNIKKMSEARSKKNNVAKQQTIVDGDNAHIVSGNNNQVGVNGDLTVTQQPELNDWYKQFFIRHIDQVKRDSSITSKMIFITVGNGSNAGKFIQQLKEYLNSNGYEINIGTAFEPITGVGVTSGLDFDNVTKIVHIYIGNINN